MIESDSLPASRDAIRRGAGPSSHTLASGRAHSLFVRLFDASGRLVKTLVRFSRSAAATPHDDGVVLHITHEQLAQAVGVARETVSLALTEMRLKNLVRTGRNQLTFNPEAIEQFVNRNGTTTAAREERTEEVAAA